MLLDIGFRIVDVSRSSQGNAQVHVLFIELWEAHHADVHLGEAGRVADVGDLLDSRLFHDELPQSRLVEDPVLIEAVAVVFLNLVLDLLKAILVVVPDVEELMVDAVATAS